MEYNIILGDLRNEAKLTQQELADILNINRVQYNQYENNYNTIPSKHLNAISNYFDVSIDYILGFTKSRKDYLNSKKEINLKAAGLRLKEFRKNFKITQKDLAKKLNTNQSVIANYERGRTLISTPFSLHHLQRI